MATLLMGNGVAINGKWRRQCASSSAHACLRRAHHAVCSAMRIMNWCRHNGFREIGIWIIVNSHVIAPLGFYILFLTNLIR